MAVAHQLSPLSPKILGRFTLLVLVHYLCPCLAQHVPRGTGPFTAAAAEPALDGARSSAKTAVTARKADGSPTQQDRSGSKVQDVLAPPRAENGTWEDLFAWGVYYSRQAVELREDYAGSWVFDRKGSKAGVPRRMLEAEELLVLAVLQAPEQQCNEKRAEQALRLYYHAKWLAERNHATAAEWRYREASRLAHKSRRNVLAAHALSRLGYFLMHWRRNAEAREALRESERLSSKSNPLAPFLSGKLERQEAGSDLSRLQAAEERILKASVQPSEELEDERKQLVREIGYWRAAQNSPRSCLKTDNAAFAMICLSSHAFLALTRAFA